MRESAFDWNAGQMGDGAESTSPRAAVRFGERARGVQIVDETLRDGLQSVSGHNAPIEQKIDLLHAMVGVGVDVVSIGLPAAGGRNAEDCYRLCREIVEQKLPLIPTAAARTVAGDVQGIARASSRAGLPIEVYAFIGSSPIRQQVEGWDLAFLVGCVTSAAKEAKKAGLTFCLVTEDTTRSHPDVLRELFRAAIGEGATRLCLCDTTGHVTPYGLEGLVTFTRAELEAIGAAHVELDWHAHNDRGLSVATALWAASHGVERVHGTGLGVGERVGNSALELLVENFGRLGARKPVPNARLVEYCELTARALKWEIPDDHPIAGKRFRSEIESRAYRIVETEPIEPADPLVPLSFRVGGAEVELSVHPRRTLLEALRYDLDFVGTKQGCDKGDCGACTVVLDGKAILSCLTLALEAEGRDVTTVECLAGAPHLDPLLDCFDSVGGGQCGFCTPGMLMSATALLDRNSRPSRSEIQIAISGNLCRCTGYGRIVDAVEMAAAIKRGEAVGGDDLPGSECAPPPLASNTRPEKRSRT
jgi:2-isopropylmalate synthase